jgi:hypothetical protein
LNAGVAQQARFLRARSERSERRHKLERRSVDEQRMRMSGVALLALAVALAGCGILDELEEGNKKMDLYMKTKPSAEEPEDAPIASGGKKQRVGEYFASQKNPKTFTPGTLSSEIVRCKLKSGTQFMKQTECVSRGGTPGR